MPRLCALPEDQEGWEGGGSTGGRGRAPPDWCACRMSHDPFPLAGCFLLGPCHSHHNHHIYPVHKSYWTLSWTLPLILPFCPEAGNSIPI